VFIDDDDDDDEARIRSNCRIREIARTSQAYISVNTRTRSPREKEREREREREGGREGRRGRGGGRETTTGSDKRIVITCQETRDRIDKHPVMRAMSGMTNNLILDTRSSLSLHRDTLDEDITETIAKRSVIELHAREQSMMLLLHNLEHVSLRRRRCGWIIWTLANFPVLHLHAQTRHTCDDPLVANVLRKRSKERQIRRSVDKKLRKDRYIGEIINGMHRYVSRAATLEPSLPSDAHSLGVRIHGLMNVKAVRSNGLE